MENNIQFLKEKVLLNETLNFNKEVEERLKTLKREKTTKPIIYVGASSCGYVAGAQKTIDAINEYITEKQIHAEIVKVGCIGLCALEPIMDVQLPGMTRVSFKKMDAENVASVLDGIFNNVIVNEFVLGQYRQKNLQKWENVNFIDEVDFFAGQKRIILELNGIIDPE